MKNILVINPGSTSTKIAFYHDGEQVWKESIEHDAVEIKKYAEIYDQKDMRTKLVRDALAAHGEKVSELDGVVARGGDQIRVGDNVIVVTLEHGLHDLRDIVED